MAVDTHGAQGKPWTGFDLDGTLATYDEWRGVSHIGEPVKPMCDLIKRLHDVGKDVKILTARVAPKDDDSDPSIARAYIEKWCEENLGFIPPITHEKDALMETLYDDRVHAVEQNTGRILNERSINMKTKSKVVANALNAVARNYKPTSEFEVGDIVRFKDSVRSVPHDETYEVIEVRDKNITIKGGRNNGTSTEFANNLEIVENADTSIVREKAVNGKFYATGYTNGGADEKQIGPFKTLEEALKAGQAEQGTRRGFTFAGVIGEDGAYVYHNSRARNVSDDSILRLCKPGNIVERGKTEDLYEVRYGGSGYIYPLVSKDRVLLKVYGDMKEARRRPLNASARNDSSSPFGFFVGEQVVIKKDASKKKYRIKEITATGDIRLDGATPLFDASELDTANYAGPYRARNSVVANALKARNAAVDVPVKFEVGKVYRAPYDRKWLAKVLSRTDSSIKVAIKSERERTWHGSDEQVTLRINPAKSVENGAEVAKGWDWEFWADEPAK
jgi:hypothetical protein